MTNIRRYDPGHAPVFITAVCRERQPFLGSDENKEMLLSVMREVKSETGFTMLGYVILSDHFHWLIRTVTLDFSAIMQSVKLRFTRRLKRDIADRDFKGCWQRRFWDHVIRDEDDFKHHLDYIHFNPVKHGYVVRPADYRFSSFATYVENGVYPQDWGCAGEPAPLAAMNLE